MIVIDAHVHIHDCYSLPEFFDAAYQNMMNAAKQNGAINDVSGVLLLTETIHADWFEKYSNFSDSGGNVTPGLGEWMVYPTEERNSLLIKKSSGEQVFVIAGRQIITAENLEVLALGTEKSFKDGLPVATAVASVLSCGALAVLPWGFGKWFGKRGSTVSKLIPDITDSRIFMGDNSGRPVFLPEPVQFSIARKAGLAILPGSDSLPLKRAQKRVGQFGAILQGQLSPKQPAKQLIALLADKSVNLSPYGHLEKTVQFFINQISLRIRKFL